ncbi:superoxide dismutase family protein [Stenotrophomonas sp. S48]|uniref:superoxide dismutase family protein n=1 Tax=Stenotrophomonas TaxID=40323 RepID=UPI000D5410DF|nr:MULTISPECIES: superoxide dismutase family protein [Stenotrophomonas]AWH19875.1 superoxide dismutase [Stenotrophomonas sp. ZAC14D2_NAIMI4_6]MBK0027369.1 superoxide dismutase family protein [Stenotrophomonas sp. S48]MBK0049719.1 superoxide dismutase family protein [Stenotrophomonas sp. S49]
MRLSHALLPLSAAVLLSACGSAPKKPQPTPPPPNVISTAQQAEANLAPASASIVSGRLVLKPESGGVHLTGLIGGLQPMQQAGFHIHERGDCSAVDASSAGNHFNPGGSAHGRAGSGKHHLGDIDNLQADAQGRANIDVHLKGVTLGGGAATDIAGRALVVHANADDYRSQPAGNAGVRIACGVIRVTR